MEVHSLQSEGYNDTQIAELMGVSRRTVKRMLCVNPEYMCVDGTQTRKTRKLLDPYKSQIRELVERGFQPSQILTKLQEMFPGIHIKRTTMSDFCIRLKLELFDYTQSPVENAPVLNDDSILSPYSDRINLMLADSKPITVIFSTIKSEGYLGSYSLLQQYCHRVKPITYRIKKATRKVKRKDLLTAAWSDKSDLSEADMAYIEANYPVFVEMKDMITEFREAYSNKDIDAVKLWCGKYAQCKFPAICSFINGIDADTDAFYNSMKYKYNNGLLEGCVNKLKAFKRSMYGRASYALLRAKLLFANPGDVFH